MKKFLLLLVAAWLLPMTVGAQPVQKIMGHYENDALSTEGFTISSSGTRSIAIILEPDELEIYQGGKVTAIRVGLAEATLISKVFLIPINANNVYGDRVEWDCEMNAAGWNVFNLPEPYELNLAADDRLLVGFYFQQTVEGKPLSFVQIGDVYDTYTYTKIGNKYRWKEVGSTANGNLSLQCVVEKDSYPDFLINASDLRTLEVIQEGDSLPFEFIVHNRGIKPIDAQALTVEVSVDGRLVTTITNERAFELGYCTIESQIPTTGIGSGEHTLAVKLVAIDGEALETPVELETSFFSYRQSYPRQKHLVEQLTSTYCTYCPLGNSMLNILTSQRDDIIWVGIHGNLNGVDPFRSDQSDSIMVYLTGGSISYPSAAFDRSTGWEDDVNIVSGIGYYEEYHGLIAEYLGEFFDYISDAMPTFAEIQGDCSYNVDTRMATVVIKGKMSPDFDLMVGEDARLNVYLTEDSLVARQLNSGVWVNGYVHNGVFRQALGSIWGVPLNKIDGNRYKNVYRFEVPSGWDWTKLNVVAFISRPMSNYVNGFTDMYVNNAEKFQFRISDAVDELVADPNAVPVEYYDVIGHRHNELQHGINIVKMSDGTARKIFVK